MLDRGSRARTQFLSQSLIYEAKRDELSGQNGKTDDEEEEEAIQQQINVTFV